MVFGSPVAAVVSLIVSVVRSSFNRARISNALLTLRTLEGSTDTVGAFSIVSIGLDSSGPLPICCFTWLSAVPLIKPYVTTRPLGGCNIPRFGP